MRRRDRVIAIAVLGLSVLRVSLMRSHPRESGEQREREAKRAMHYCLRSGDKTCVNMCKQWMKERKLKFRGR